MSPKFPMFVLRSHLSYGSVGVHVVFHVSAGTWHDKKQFHNIPKLNSTAVQCSAVQKENIAWRLNPNYIKESTSLFSSTSLSTGSDFSDNDWRLAKLLNRFFFYKIWRELLDNMWNHSIIIAQGNPYRREKEHMEWYYHREKEGCTRAYLSGYAYFFTG